MFWCVYVYALAPSFDYVLFYLLYLLYSVAYITDIDECADLTHSCSSDADCTNIAGGYTCQCHPGFTGDGMNCTGESSIISIW